MKWRGFRVLMTEKLALELIARFADACEVRGDLDTTVRVHDNRESIEHGNHPSGLHTDAGEPVPDAVPRPLVRLGIGKEEDAPLAAAERTDIYEDLG